MRQTTRIVAGLVTFLLAATIISKANPITDKSWSTVEEQHLGGISMRLKLKANPSLIDTRWISLEFENMTGEAIPVKDVAYHLVYRIYDKKGGKLLREAQLSSRSPAEIIDGAFESPVPVVKLSPGKSQSSRFPSAFGASLLGLPDKTPLYVEATAEVAVELSKIKDLNFAWKDLHFSFSWTRPEPIEFSALYQRLLELLEQPEYAPFHHHDLYTLLAAPEVSAALTVDQLINALQKRSGKEDGRLAILYHLNERFAKDKKLLDHYTNLLRQQDLQAIADLAEAPEIWDDRFLEPLIQLYQQANTGIMFRVMDVLYSHQSFWIKKEGITKILSDLLLYKYEKIIYETPENLSHQDLLEWSSAVTMLGKTGNKEVIPLLCPFLQCRERVLAEAIQLDFKSMELPRAMRVCDNALEALLRLEEKDLFKVYKKAGYAPPYENGEAEIIIDRIRDNLIKEAKRKKRVCR